MLKKIMYEKITFGEEITGSTVLCALNNNFKIMQYT